MRSIRKAAQDHTHTLRAQIKTYEKQVRYWTERQADIETKLHDGEKHLSGIRKTLNNTKQQLAELEEALNKTKVPLPQAQPAKKLRE